MTDNLAATIAAAANPGAILRTGTLLAITGTTIAVNIGGSQVVTMPYLATYTPALGDHVQVIQQGPLNLVIGATDATDDGNPLTNPSFENDPDGTAPPTGWALYQTGTTDNTATAVTATEWGPKDGVMWLRVTHGVTAGTSTVYVISDPIPVTPGEIWTARAHTVTGGITSQPIVQLRLAFFADAATAYPSYLAETIVQRITGPTGPRWLPLRAITGAGTPVPDGATAMRVALSAQMIDGNVWFDQITARKLAPL